MRRKLSQPVISGHFPSQQLTIHQLLFIVYYSSFYYSSFSDSVCDSEKHYYSHDTIHHGREITIHDITHFIVNRVYGYSNSRNRVGLTANSCINRKSISYGLEIVCISSRGHLHTIPLVGFTNLHFSYIWRITYIHIQTNVNAWSIMWSTHPTHPTPILTYFHTHNNNIKFILLIYPVFWGFYRIYRYTIKTFVCFRYFNPTIILTPDSHQECKFMKFTTFIYLVLFRKKINF